MSDGSSLFFGTAAAYEAPNGAILPKTAPLVISVPHAQYNIFKPIFLKNSVRAVRECRIAFTSVILYFLFCL